MPLKPNILEFPGLSHHGFQHELDSQALASLEKIPLLGQITRKLSEAYMERVIRIQHISSSLRVSQNQYPSLHRQYVKMARVLDVRKLPDLFVSTSNIVNAYAIGIQNPSIVVNSGLIDIMSDNELLAILGHELGHVKCEHMLYTTMVNMLRMFGANVIEQFLPGVGSLASAGFQLALLEWYRKAEYSCDRAALICTQEVDVVCSALAKLAGFSKNLGDGYNIDAVKAQAEEYQDIGNDSLMNKLLKVYVMLGNTHPYPVVRVNEISKWGTSADYQKMLSGEYKKLMPTAPKPEISSHKQLNAPTGIICPRCRAVWPEDVSFCGKCAMNLRDAQLICGQCLAPIEPAWIVCAQCGSKLIAD